MNRYRIQTRTTADGKTETHVSSVILSADEATADILTEADIARAAGWHTTMRGHGIGTELGCSRGRTVRILTIRQSDAFDDSLS